MTNADDGVAAADAGAEAIGMGLPAAVPKVGVLKDERGDASEAAVTAAGLAAIQLHGDS